jgi:curved DNA-binding protein CbpA
MAQGHGTTHGPVKRRTPPGYTRRVARRDPHDVLGVAVGATPTEIKAAWRRLARSNHPDLTGDDPAASRAATRRMAEINEAYASLTRVPRRDSRGGEAADMGTTAPRRGGPPRPKPTRPVTARVDTTTTFQPRNQTTVGSRRGTPIQAQPPRRAETVRQDALRASTPTGPMERDRLRNFRRPKPPSLEVARAHQMEFGKFHGHTLGQIAAFEPSYIDWVAGTVTRDPELVAAARVIQADLDGRGVARRAHPTPIRAGRTA